MFLLSKDVVEMKSDGVSAIVTPVLATVLSLGFLYLLFREEPETKKEIPTEGGLGLSKEEREMFIPTAEWKPVEDHHFCPPGLEYRLDLSNGTKLARIPPQ